MSLSGTVVLVVGAGENGGRDRAQQFASAGANVALHFISADEAGRHRKVLEDVAQGGARISAHVNDLATDAAIQRLVMEIFRLYKTLDIIVSPAGGRVRKDFTPESAAQQVKVFAYAAHVDAQYRRTVSQYKEALQSQAAAKS